MGGSVKEKVVVYSENDILRMDILDYLKPIEFSMYSNRLNVSMNVLWNGDRQRINKGNYYVLSKNDTVYYVLLNDEFLKIDQINKINNGTKENILTFDIIDYQYSYVSYEHDIYGSTHNIDYYNSMNTVCLANLLSKEDAFSEISNLINSVYEIFKNTNIYDIDLVSNKILGDMSKKVR